MVAADGSVHRDFSPSVVRKSVEFSLRNLQRERLELLHLHAPSTEHVTEELLRCLEDLQRAGLVCACGINGFGNELQEHVLANPILSTMMFDFNLLSVERKEYIERLVVAGKGVFASTPLAQAYFSNKLFKPMRLADLWYLARALRKHPDKLLRGFKFRFVNDYPGWSGAEVALAYVLANPGVSAAVFGTTNTRRLLENLRVSGRKLPKDIMQRIEST